MKAKKLLKEKNLSGLGGVKEVSFGPASPERRENRDFSKSGIPAAESHTFDDYTERRERWGLQP